MSYLSTLASRDQALTAGVASLPWVLDGIAEDEKWALQYLSDLYEQDPTLGALFAGVPWVADNITEHEKWALRFIEDIHGRDASLGEAVAAFPWVSDDIAADERWALQYLNDLHSQDTAVGALFAGAPWVGDNIAEHEQWSLRYINDIHRRDASLGAEVATFPWVSDDITEDERWALQSLDSLHEQDIPLGAEIAGLPWVVDDIAEDEWLALFYLNNLYEQDASAGAAIAELLWVADDITDDERSALRYLSDLAEKDKSLAGQLAAMPFLTTSVDTRDQHALSSMVTLSESGADLALLTEQGWFQAGLDDDEAAFVSVLADLAERSPGEFRDMVDTHYTQSTTVSLPLAGDIQLVAFRATPFQANNDLIDQVENAVRSMEGLMRVPFPRREVVVLFVDPMHPPGDPNTVIVALNVGTHMVITRPEVTRGDYRETVAHEVAHYYWGSGDTPLWFREGGSDFLASYALDQSGWKSLESRNADLGFDEVRYCDRNGIQSIRKLNDLLALQGYAAHAATAYFICNYYLGEHLLLNLYQTMGPEASSNAWNELYLLAQAEGLGLTEDEIYQAFLRNTPASEVDEFKSLYDQWHG